MRSCQVECPRFDILSSRIPEDLRNSARNLRNPEEFSGILAEFADSLRIERGNHEQTMRINPERLETDHFHCRVSRRITFCNLLSLPEPAGAKSCQIEFKTQSPNCTRRDLSIDTAGSFVLTPAPIGMDRQSAYACFSRLPCVRPCAETGRPVSKSILIGALDSLCGEV